MLKDPMFLLPALAALVVAGILMFGIGSFARGGEFNRRNANRIMRWRLAAQFVAVVVILAIIALWFGGQQGMLPWQPEPTRIPVTPFANLPNTAGTPVP